MQNTSRNSRHLYRFEIVYGSVQGVPKALEIAEQYIREKEILHANEPNKEVLTKKLTDRLIVRFRGKKARYIKQFILHDANTDFADINKTVSDDFVPDAYNTPQG